jgi:cytidylate kinase
VHQQRKHSRTAEAAASSRVKQRAMAAISRSTPPPLPVIAIDGPSGSGKGTVAKLVAQNLGFHYLDSGALYRLVALAAERGGISLNDEARLAEVAAVLDVQFTADVILLAGEDVSLAIREEGVSRDASIVSAYPKVRCALLERQRAFRKLPGLVAEGRDMASVVFPDARLKIFLTASVKERVKRRYKQLSEKGMHANLDNLLRDIAKRDERDSNRAVAPLVQSPDAMILDTTNLSIAQAVCEILDRYAAR